MKQAQFIAKWPAIRLKKFLARFEFRTFRLAYGNQSTGDLAYTPAPARFKPRWKDYPPSAAETSPFPAPAAGGV